MNAVRVHTIVYTNVLTLKDHIIVSVVLVMKQEIEAVEVCN